MLGFGSAMAEEATGEIPAEAGAGTGTGKDYIIRARRRGRR